jgi:hypothetical protein
VGIPQPAVPRGDSRSVEGTYIDINIINKFLPVSFRDFVVVVEPPSPNSGSEQEAEHRPSFARSDSYLDPMSLSSLLTRA